MASEVIAGIECLRNNEKFKSDNELINLVVKDFYECEIKGMFHFWKLVNSYIEKDIIAHYEFPFGSMYKIPVYLYNKRYNLVHRKKDNTYEFRICENSVCKREPRNKCKCPVTFTCEINYDDKRKENRFNEILMNIYLNYGVIIKNINPDKTTFALNNIIEFNKDNFEDIKFELKFLRFNNKVLLIIIAICLIFNIGFCVNMLV